MNKAKADALADFDKEVVDGFNPPLLCVRQATKISTAILRKRPVNDSSKPEELKRVAEHIRRVSVISGP